MGHFMRVAVFVAAMSGAAILAALGGAEAQQAGDAASAETQASPGVFNVTLDRGQDDRALLWPSLAALSDGGFAIVSGLASNDKTRFALLVARLDAQGGVTWRKTIETEKDDSVNSIAATPDGGFALAGEVWSKGAGRGDAWALRFDAQGVLLWDKTYGGVLRDYANSVAALADGGMALAGTTKSKGSGFGDAWVLRLDAQGGQAWDRTYLEGKAAYASFIAARPKGGFVLASDEFSLDIKEVGVAMRLDDKGRVLWRKVFGNPGGIWQAVAAPPDGGLVMAGGTTTTNKTHVPWAVRLDDDGGVVWEKTFSGGDGGGASRVVVLSDGGFAVLASISSGDAHDARLLRLDAKGALLWEKVYSRKEGETITDLAALPGNRLAVAGLRNGALWLFVIPAEGPAASAPN